MRVNGRFLTPIILTCSDYQAKIKVLSKDERNLEVKRNCCKYVFVLSFAVLLLIGCGGGNGPKDAVVKYLKAVKNHDIDVMIDMVNWEGEQERRYRITQLSLIRSILKIETEHFECQGRDKTGKDFFDHAIDVLERANEILLKKDTDSFAEVVCYDENSSIAQFELEKVNDVWKIKYGRNECLFGGVPEFDRMSPFCSDFAMGGSCKGAKNPREVVERCLQAMADFDLTTYDQTLAFPKNQGESALARFGLKTAEVDDKMRRIGLSYRVTKVAKKGEDQAIVTIKSGDHKVQISVIKRNGIWLLVDFDPLSLVK